MTVEPPAAPEPPAPPSRPIANSWRWFAGALGLGGLGAGGVAVFTTDVEAGPVALLLVGAVFALVAMSGRLPTRLKVGENEAEWQAVQEYVRETVEEASPEEKPQEAIRAAQLADAVPQVRLRYNEPTVPLTDSVFAALSQAFLASVALRVPEVRLISKVDARHRDLGFDAAYETADGSQRMYVVFKVQIPPGFDGTLERQLDGISENDRIVVAAATLEGPHKVGSVARSPQVEFVNISKANRAADFIEASIRRHMLGEEVGDPF